MQIDDDFINSIGLSGLNEDQKNDALRQIADIFEFRFGNSLADQLSDEQLDQFAKIDTSGDRKELDSWLSVNVPDYESMGENVLKQLCTELKETHKEVLGF